MPMPTSTAACTRSPTGRPRPTRAAREAARRFLNAARPEEIIFTRSATEAINLVASSFAGPRIGEGDEIVLSIMEHHSNIVPWHFHARAQGRGAEVGRRRATTAASTSMRSRRRCRRKTRMVAVTHMSNVLGTVTPIERDHRDRPCAGHPGADRRQPGRGAPQGRRAGPRRRFLRLHRPQALRADRHRRALRQGTSCWPTCSPTRAAAR